MQEHIDSLAVPCFAHQATHQGIDSAVQFVAGQRCHKLAHFVSGRALSHHPTLGPQLSWHQPSMQSEHGASALRMPVIAPGLISFFCVRPSSRLQISIARRLSGPNSTHRASICAT
jgi:hypothetical protein